MLNTGNSFIILKSIFDLEINMRGKGTHGNKAPQRERQGDSRKSSTPKGSTFRHIHAVDSGLFLD